MKPLASKRVNLTMPRRGVDAARTTVERFQEVQSVIETDPYMWRELLSDEYDRRKTVTEPLELLIEAQLKAEYHGAKGRCANVEANQPVVA